MISYKTMISYLAVFAALSVPPVLAGEGDTPSMNPLQPTPPASSQKLKPEEMLTDLRDARLCLAQVKQQAVNVFLEATRTLVTPTEPAQEHTPSEINAKMLDEKEDYLPPRKEWLVFYVNTLEPTIHLLAEDLKDVDANHERYPVQFKKALAPLWKPWHDDVLSMNKSLDEIQELITPDKATNVPLAKAALSIFQKATQLEKVRFHAAKTVRQEYSKTGTAKAVKSRRKASKN